MNSQANSQVAISDSQSHATTSWIRRQHSDGPEQRKRPVNP